MRSKIKASMQESELLSFPDPLLQTDPEKTGPHGADKFRLIKEAAITGERTVVPLRFSSYDFGTSSITPVDQLPPYLRGLLAGEIGKMIDSGTTDFGDEKSAKIVVDELNPSYLSTRNLHRLRGESNEAHMVYPTTVPETIYHYIETADEDEEHLTKLDFVTVNYRPDELLTIAKKAGAKNYDGYARYVDRYLKKNFPTTSPIEKLRRILLTHRT